MDVTHAKNLKLIGRVKLRKTENKSENKNTVNKILNCRLIRG